MAFGGTILPAGCSGSEGPREVRAPGPSCRPTSGGYGVPGPGTMSVRLSWTRPLGTSKRARTDFWGWPFRGGCWVVSTPNMVQVSFSRVTSMTL